jgi:hypothetical protein
MNRRSNGDWADRAEEGEKTELEMLKLLQVWPSHIPPPLNEGEIVDLHEKKRTEVKYTESPPTKLARQEWETG